MMEPGNPSTPTPESAKVKTILQGTKKKNVSSLLVVMVLAGLTPVPYSHDFIRCLDDFNRIHWNQGRAYSSCESRVTETEQVLH